MKRVFTAIIALMTTLGMISGCSSTKSTDTKTSSTPHQDTVTTASGLKYIDTKIGTGPSPQKGQRVTVNYTGTLTNGTAFDSNVLPEFGHQSPFIFTIGVHQVISGWDEGVMTMKVEGQRRLIVPANLAYGNRAVGDKIPANSMLIFDVELLKVQ